MTNQRDEREVAERFWIERRTQHTFTTKPDPYVETVEVGLVADFNAHYEDLMRAALSREANAALRMRERCLGKVREIHEGRLKDLRTLTENGEVEQEDAEYERAVLFVLSNVIDAIKSLTLDGEPLTHA